MIPLLCTLFSNFAFKTVNESKTIN
jgi:hypothetical protein